MFYYYGRKQQVGGYYPAPTRRTIVEPFARAAAYAHRWISHVDEVVLVERDPTVCAMWQALLDPTLEVDELVPPIALGENTTNLFHLAAAVSGGGPYLRLKATPFMVANVERLRRRLPEDRARWFDTKVTVIPGDYSEAPDIDATWFIDPPYQGHAGSLYKYGSGDIDFAALATWCRARAGQVIVCEGEGADWLPFEKLASVIGVAGKVSQEVVWYGGSAHEHGRLL